MNWDDRVIEAGRACQISRIDKPRLRTWRKRGMLRDVGIKSGRWRLTARETLLLAIMGSMPPLKGNLAQRVSAMKIHVVQAEQIKPNDLVLFNPGEGVNIRIADEKAIEEMQKRRLLVTMFVPVGKIVSDVRFALTGR